MPKLISVTAEICVEFNQIKYNVSEGDGFVLLTLVSNTSIDTEYTVDVVCQDRTARGMYVSMYILHYMYADWWQYQRQTGSF